MQGKAEEALAHYREAVANKPDYFAARYNLGTYLTDLGRYDEAIFNLRYAVQLKDDAQAWTNLGVAELKSGHRSDAVRSFQNALRINPNLQQAQMGLDAALGRRK
jgi:tetratricopeptide (TPR) repeat protein